MTQLPSDDQVWAPCTPGSLARYASQHRGRRRRVAAAKIAGGSLVCVLAISIGWKLSHDGQLREFNFGGIACHEVQRLMPQYMMKELPAETSDKIQSHLAQCPMRWRFPAPQSLALDGSHLSKRREKSSLDDAGRQ
jgi:hypothetical protein